MEKQKKKAKQLCCLCGKQLENEYGNNPDPVSKEGSCCDKCNYLKVIPARVIRAKKYEQSKMY